MNYTSYFNKTEDNVKNIR